MCGLAVAVLVAGRARRLGRAHLALRLHTLGSAAGRGVGGGGFDLVIGSDGFFDLTRSLFAGGVCRRRMQEEDAGGGCRRRMQEEVSAGRVVQGGILDYNKCVR